MAQVPDYLLQRSRERRAALGLPPFGSPEGAAPAPPEGGGEGPAAAPAERAPAVPAPAAAPAPAAEAPAAAVTAPAPRPYLAPPSARSGIPAWVLPVLAVIPVWAFAYVGALSPPATTAPV